MIGWLFLVAVLVGLGALPFLIEKQRQPVSAYRGRAPGEFMRLSQGLTHYQWLGPEDGQVIVCVHGLTTPSPVWYAIASRLAESGFRVLIYDLYGRGFSDTPRGDQTGAFFSKQLIELLDALKISNPIPLVGYSMGGAIATDFTARHPRRIANLVLIASGGMVLRENRLTRFSRGWPLLGDWVHAVICARIDRREIRDQLGLSFEIEGIVELQLAEYQSRGFLRSVLSSRRNILAKEQEEEHQVISKNGVSVLAIWAEKDDVIPLRALGFLKRWNPMTDHKVLQGADHRCAYMNSAEIARMIIVATRNNHN